MVWGGGRFVVGGERKQGRGDLRGFLGISGGFKGRLVIDSSGLLGWEDGRLMSRVPRPFKSWSIEAFRLARPLNGRPYVGACSKREILKQPVGHREPSHETASCRLEIPFIEEVGQQERKKQSQ
jgi:hypothetical protein